MEEHGKGIKKGTMPQHYRGPNPSIGAKALGNRNEAQSADRAKFARSRKRRDELERQFEDPNKPTDYEEVWFAGVHCGMYSL